LLQADVAPPPEQKLQSCRKIKRKIGHFAQYWAQILGSNAENNIFIK
jgi:hypothetical protein